MKSYIPLVIAGILSIAIGYSFSVILGGLFLIVGFAMFALNTYNEMYEYYEDGVENHLNEAMTESVKTRTQLLRTEAELTDLKKRIMWIEQNAVDKNQPFGG